MDGRVKHESGHVNAEVGGAGLHHVALHVDLDQAGGGNLVVQHTEGVDQEMFGVLTDANGDVVIDALGPAMSFD